jgi:hypothetical protein
MTISGRQAVCTARTRAFTRTASEKQPAVASVHIGGSGASAPSSAVTFCQDMLLFRALGKLLRGFQRRVAAGYGQANLPCRLGGEPVTHRHPFLSDGAIWRIQVGERDGWICGSC